MAEVCAGCSTSRAWYAPWYDKCLRCQPLPRSTQLSPPSLFYSLDTNPSGQSTQDNSALPLSYALAAHKGNGGQISQVDGINMSSALAGKMAKNVKGYGVHKVQLRATQHLIQKRLRQHVFRFMDLPQEIRDIILSLLVGGSCSAIWASGWPENPVSYTEDPNILPVTAWVGNRMLRLETILVTLRKLELDVGSGSYLERFGRWLSGIELAPAHQAGVTQLSSAFEALTRLTFNCVDVRLYPFVEGAYACQHSDTLSRDKVFLESCKNLRSIKIKAYMSRQELCRPDIWDPLGDAKSRFPVATLLRLQKLETPCFVFRSSRNWFDGADLTWADATSRLDIVAAWFEGKYLQRGRKVKATWLQES